MNRSAEIAKVIDALPAIKAGESWTFPVVELDIRAREAAPGSAEISVFVVRQRKDFSIGATLGEFSNLESLTAFLKWY